MSVRLRLLDAARALAFNKTVPESPEKKALQEAIRDAESQYWDNDAEEEAEEELREAFAKCRPTICQWAAVIAMLIFVLAYRLAFAVAIDDQRAA